MNGFQYDCVHSARGLTDDFTDGQGQLIAILIGQIYYRRGATRLHTHRGGNCNE